MKRQSELLMAFKKDEIIDAAFRLGMPPIRKSAKKAEWAAYIENSMAEYGENLMLLMRQEEAELLQKHLAQGLTFRMDHRSEDAAVLMAALDILDDLGLVEWESGVCQVDESGCLAGVKETTHIISTCDGPMFTEDGETYHRLPEDAAVSMNMFGFTPSIIDEMKVTFPIFHQTTVKENPLKSEYYLPMVVNGMLEKETASVEVLKCPSRWYGVTYQADKPMVKEALAKMAEDGLYPTPLWN